jgi:hypothetical protein
MQLFYARQTFSEGVLSWWRELPKGHMMRGEEPCRTWDGMKDVLQRHFGNGIKFLDTKPIVPSSWSDVSLEMRTFLFLAGKLVLLILMRRSWVLVLDIASLCILKLLHLLRPIRRTMLIHININLR